MTMPKGYRSKHGYATVKTQLGGLGYREISEKMCEDGYKMNHSTASNLFINSLIKVAAELSVLYDLNLDHAALKKIAINPSFQESVRDFMFDSHDRNV